MDEMSLFPREPSILTENLFKTVSILIVRDLPVGHLLELGQPGLRFVEPLARDDVNRGLLLPNLEHLELHIPFDEVSEHSDCAEAKERMGSVIKSIANYRSERGKPLRQVVTSWGNETKSPTEIPEALPAPEPPVNNEHEIFAFHELYQYP